MKGSARAAGHVVEHCAHSLSAECWYLVVELLHDDLHRKRRVEGLRVALRVILKEAHHRSFHVWHWPLPGGP